MMNVETELHEQLGLVNKLIEDLKLHSFVQAMAMNGSKVVSSQDLEENGEVCLMMRNKLEEVLVVLKDIKENSFDELSYSAQEEVSDGIIRCRQNIDGFDRSVGRILKKGK